MQKLEKVRLGKKAFEMKNEKSRHTHKQYTNLPKYICVCRFPQNNSISNNNNNDTNYNNNNKKFREFAAC